jgi:hypothetical protein
MYNNDIPRDRRSSGTMKEKHAEKREPIDVFNFTLAEAIQGAKETFGKATKATVAYTIAENIMKILSPDFEKMRNAAPDFLDQSAPEVAYKN